MQFAHDRGAATIALTDSETSPLAPISTLTLLAKSDMASFVDSLVAPLSLINALIVAIGRKKNDDLSQTFETLEQIWDEYEVYEKVEEIDLKHVIVIGGGAAGCMAAVAAAQKGAAVTLLERNPKLGRKLYITGKGRCNVTNDCAAPEVLQNVPRNSRFLTSAVTRFPPEAVKAFFEGLGVPLKTERGNRVFPCSDKAADIIDALLLALRRSGVHIVQDRARALRREGAILTGVEGERGFYPGGAVVIATGGVSYPLTGSTGDGYALAVALGHTILPPRGSLVPLVAEGDACAKMQGLSLRNVAIQVRNSKKKTVYAGQGELLFTHFGLSGPLILSASAHMRDFDTEHYYINLDLKPALDEEKLDRRLLRDFEENANRDFHNVLEGLVPRLMVPVLVERTGIPADGEGSFGDEGPAPPSAGGPQVPAHRHTGAPPGGGGHRHIRRGKGIRDQSHHYGIQEGPRRLFCRGGAGRGCLYRRLQSANCLVHRPRRWRGRAHKT